MQAISTEQALRRAFWVITVPSMLCFFGPLAAFLYWSNSPSSHGAGFRGLWLLGGALLGGFLMSWLVWSIGVPRWRLWAYQRVSNIQILKCEAEAARLLWPEGHIFERTELASKELRMRISEAEMAKSGISPAA